MKQLKTVLKCPVCESTELKDHLSVLDHSISQEVFIIQECQDCKFKLTNPRPEGSLLDTYYESEAYVSHTDSDKTLINKIYKVARNFTLKQKVKIINQNQPSKGKLLDIGCGTGHFLSQAKKDGWEIQGIEPNSKARALAKEQTKTSIKKTLQDQTGSFQAITMWHVLEHLEKLNEDLNQISNLLAKTGTVFFAVPNHESWDAKHYGSNWAAYDVPRHLYHFSQNTIARAASKHGLKLSDTIPMKLDSYYVSLLSEQYKSKGILNLPIAFLKGLYSNFAASSNNKNYSSLIYVFQKE